MQLAHGLLIEQGMNVETTCRAAIDQAYASFLAELPATLVTAAERLPRWLGLASRGDVGWSDVFEDLPILGLPSMFLAEATVDVGEDIHRCAQRAHLFALIAARITGAVDADTVELDEELEALLGATERERNRALAELRLRGADRLLNFSVPEREVRAALADERSVFAGRLPATIADYLTISTAKQSLAFPATLAAVSVSVSDMDCKVATGVYDVVLGSMLGVQIRSDVEAWLESPRRNSWVNALSGGRATIDVIQQMLDLSRDAFNKAADAARELGATSLMRWARMEANSIRELGRLAERQLNLALAV
jgi:hypothetical protein